MTNKEQMARDLLDSYDYWMDENMDGNPNEVFDYDKTAENMISKGYVHTDWVEVCDGCKGIINNCHLCKGRGITLKNTNPTRD